MTVWRPIEDNKSGYVFNLSEELRHIESKNPDLFIPLTDSDLVIASDYSGQHKEATHEAYSFVVTNFKYLNEWLPSLNDFRNRNIKDDRRISFKKLREPVRWRALPEFLKVIGALKSNLITILVDRKVGNFIQGGTADAVATFPDCFSSGSKPGTVEKMIRLASFVALIVSGMRLEGQTSIWISDNDEALDTDEKREQFSRLATYITFGITRWLNPADSFFCTTGSPNAPYWSEDLTAIADLAAGAYCQLSSHLPSYTGVAGSKFWQISRSSNCITDNRARLIGNWLNSKRHSIRARFKSS